MTEAHLWKNGRIFTGSSYREALLVEGNRVVAVGSLREVLRQCPTGVERHDLAGGLILPGLIDAHLHLADLALQERGVDGSTARSVPELVERARRWAEHHPAGPIVGSGWSLSGRPHSEWPSRNDLDRVTQDRPVVLYHASGHAAVVNSAALAQLGIGPDTRDPPGGRIGRGRDREPDGRLFEKAVEGVAQLAHEGLIAEPASIEGLLGRLASLGIACVGTLNSGPSELTALSTLADGGRLPLEVRPYLALAWFQTLSDDTVRALVPSRGRLRVDGVKGMADGAFGSRTAWLSQPYLHDGENAGMLVHREEELVEAFQRARRLGLTPAVHALGDRGVEHAVRVLEGSREAGHASLDRLEHAGLVPPTLWPLLEKVRPMVVAQPSFIWTDHWLADQLGSERCRYAYPLGTLRRLGCELAGSSDAPFDRLDPWWGMQAAHHRRDPEGRSANPAPEEELTTGQSFALYTEGGARALREPDLGSLRVGAHAHLVWMHSADLDGSVRGGSTALRETWIDGERVYPVRQSDLAEP